VLTPTFIFLGAALICFGGAIGFWASRNIAASANNKQLEQRLQETTAELEKATSELKSYRNNVTEHFTETARLVDNLNQSYKQVHDHLAQGVGELIPEETRQKILNSSSVIHLETANTEAPAEVQPGAQDTTAEAESAQPDKVESISNDTSSEETSTPTTLGSSHNQLNNENIIDSEKEQSSSEQHKPPETELKTAQAH